nr:hypothetical protein [Tanacetum cinerariifolium]
MLVIKRFRERKKIFRERKLSEKFVQRAFDVRGQKLSRQAKVRGKTNKAQPSPPSALGRSRASPECDFYGAARKIGYKNPSCLTRAKQVQPALYNGHEIIKDNHTPAIVHNSEDTLETAEITRKKMDDKMNDPECVIHKTTDSQITKLTDQVTYLQAQNDLFRAENDKIMQQYKELYDSIKITRAKHIKQELLEYAIGTCPQGSQPRAKQLAHISLIRKKQVTVAQPSNKLDSTIHRHVVTVKSQKTNVHVPPSTGVNSCPNASESPPKSHVKPNRISPAKGDNKLPVDDQPKKNKSHLRTSNRIDSSSRLKRTVINSHSDSICQTCNKCLTPFNHDLCVATCLQSAVATPSIRHNSSVERKVKQVWKPKQVRQVWKPTGKILTTIGYQWRPTGRISI